jgi:predicted HAD superfamily Cof-like phosphohydrolase
MATHKRSELNKAIDQCPEIVQQAVWGESGLRAQVEILTDALEYAYGKLYTLTNTRNCFRRGDCKTDAEKAFSRVSEALTKVKGGGL